jgi:phenylpropionate dioxygenase-like ring-hydroxylating dioxygenase large terminal subunit
MNDDLTTLGSSRYDPQTWTVSSPDAVESADRKSPPLARLYPEKADYLILDAKRYYAANFAEQEWQKVWSRTWTCAGRAADIREPGEWFKYDLGRESLIVVRQRDLSIKAFYNACQHRGRQLVTTDFGRSYSFVCPYHSWVYGLDGANRRVTTPECFDPRALCGDLGLKPVRCESWAGFVFVSLDDDAPPLLDFLDELPDTLSAFRMEDMCVVKDVVVEVPCNWKAAMEAFLEPYHAHVTHAQILPAVDELCNQYDFYRNGHARVITPVGLPSPRYADQNTVNPALAFMLLEVGIDPTTFEGTAHGVRSAVWAAKRNNPDNPYGVDYAGFTDSQLTDDWNPSIFPNMTINLHPEGALVMRFLPHPSDPGKCLYNVWVLLPKFKAGTPAPWYFGVDPQADVTGATRPARRYASLDDPGLGQVLEQDLTNLVAMQRGLMSRGMRDGIRLGELEQRIQQLHAELDRLIART